MRIAISGTHYSGKTTLVEALSEALPQYLIVEEPYALLAEEGEVFSDPPSLEDFELQLDRSVENLDERGPDVIFDRCPVDILGYILIHPDADAFAVETWLSRVQAAVRTLDVIVFLPIEEPDRIDLPLSQDAGYRKRVDEKLKELLLDDTLGLDVEALTISGSLPVRAERVLAFIGKEKK